MFDFIIPNWAVPAPVRACTTTRQGGYSVGPFAGFNLATGVGDAGEAVEANRAALVKRFNFPSEPVWLQQVHGDQTVIANSDLMSRVADASLATEPGQVCVVLTADCLPVLFCDRAGTCVAAAHAGWRGLLAGVLEASWRGLQIDARDTLVWLGPAIGPEAFEVGEAVRRAFVAAAPEAERAFIAIGEKRWMADIYELARQRLTKLGVTAITGGEYCTYTDAGRFYSYRRDRVTGRMASLIWLEQVHKIG